MLSLDSIELTSIRLGVLRRTFLPQLINRLKNIFLIGATSDAQFLQFLTIKIIEQPVRIDVVFQETLSVLLAALAQIRRPSGNIFDGFETR